MTQIIEDIHQVNWLQFGPGKLKELCKLLPEESEVMFAHVLPRVYCLYKIELIIISDMLEDKTKRLAILTLHKDPTDLSANI